jgi:acyl-CoA oxidase
VLSDFRQQFESTSATGIARYLLRKTKRTITEAAPITLSTTDESDIRSPHWQVEQLAWKETHQVESLAERIRRRIGDGLDPFDAFTQVQTHAGAAAASHIDRLVLEAFASAVENIEDLDLRAALDRVRSLHGLTTIQRDLAWFQEHSHLSAATAKAIRHQHNQLVGEVAADSLALVDAFGIPDNVIAAPIALRDQKGNEQ